jgi:undecaprenyl-diphosphatase
MATVFSTYYPVGKWGFFGWAALVALSRPAVGVHYPSDIIGGALIGFALAWLVIFIWNKLSKMFEKETATIPPSQSYQ